MTELVKLTKMAARALTAVLLSAGSAVWFAAPAGAQQMNGYYVGLGAGFNYTQQLKTNLRLSPGSSVGNVVTRPLDLGGGFAVLGSGGFGFGNGARVEVEANVRRNGLNHVSGAETKYGVFTNALYDANLGVSWVVPYAGLGIGFQALNLSNATIRGANGGPSSTASGTSALFAYQGILGAGFPIPSVPGLSVTAEYRYMRTAGSRTYSGSTETATPTSSRVRLGDDANHAMIVGLRYGFGAAPAEDDNSPPPLISAMAPPPRSYVVYFDANSTALTVRARDVIAEAAQASSRLAYTRIEVSGHTDVTGAKASNIVLSRARANAVADELVREGIARSVIEIHAFGDEKPAAIPKPGLSEPRNRRVEILYQ